MHVCRSNVCAIKLSDHELLHNNRDKLGNLGVCWTYGINLCATKTILHKLIINCCIQSNNKLKRWEYTLPLWSQQWRYNHYLKKAVISLYTAISNLHRKHNYLSWNSISHYSSSTMCGQCKDNFTTSTYSYDLRCVKCSGGHYNWAKYVAVALLPPTALFW